MDKNQKIIVLSVLCILMIAVNGYMISNDNDPIPTIIMHGIGMSLISIPAWILLGGFVLFNIVLWLANLFNKEQKVIFTPIDKANVGIIIGLVLKLLVPGIP